MKRQPERLALNAARDTVQRFREVWSQERSNLPLSQDVIQAVERQLSLVPLARQQRPARNAIA